MRTRPLDRPSRRPSRRLRGVIGVSTAAALVVTTLGLSSDPVSSPAAAADQPEIPSLLAPASAAGADGTAGESPRAVAGSHRLVTVDADLLGARSAGQRLRLPVAGGDAVVRLTSVEHESSYTAWRGTVEGEPASGFSVVRAGSVLRGGLQSPDGVYALTDAGGGRYWWTKVDPKGGHLEDDAATVPRSLLRESAAAASSASAAVPAASKPRRRGKAKVGVMFGFTKGAKAALGSRAAVKAAAALAIDQTNQSLANSGVKVKVKLKGVVKGKGPDTGNTAKDLTRLFKIRDGKFDNLSKKRKRKRADLVHLLTAGDPAGNCGRGYLPRRPRETHPRIGYSTSFVACLPYLTATHEIGHNLGADHDKYPGVTHDSRMKGSFGFVNVAGGYITVMAYYNKCVDAGVYTCVPVPFFSTPSAKRLFNGQPVGDSKRTNNASVIKKTAPRVARYYR